jgi:hypothetical protein
MQTKTKPPVIGSEQVTAQCGHAVTLELFETKQDKYREQRRNNLGERACPACRQQAHAERVAKEKAEAEEKRKNAPPGKVRPDQGRLPNGATYHCVYDAARQKWVGTLTIPGEKEPLVFSSEKSGVFRLLQILDGKFRQAAGAEIQPKE